MFAKSSIVDARLGSKYKKMRNKTKFGDTKEHFLSEGLLNICKLDIFSLNTTVHLQIPAVQKQSFTLLFGLFKRFHTVSHVYATNPLL